MTLPRLVARRGATQLPLLAAVLVVVTVGATVLGVCALLLTSAAPRSLDLGLAAAPASDVDATAYLGGVRDAPGVAADAAGVLRRAYGPVPVTTSVRASSAVRLLSARPRRVAYLSAVDGLPSRARLLSGRWPRSGRSEAAVLSPTAAQLSLRPGSTVDLGPEAGGSRGLRVVVVGVLRALPAAGWDRDPLRGAGFDPGYRDPQPATAYGPFLVPAADLYAGGSTVDRLQVTAHPDLSGPAPAAAAAGFAGADRALTAAVGDRVEFERVAAALPGTVARARAQQDVTRSAVLVVALFGAVLTVVALGLVGRLVAGRRSAETALFASVGAGRRQLVGIAAVETGILALAGGALAVPAAALVYAGLPVPGPVVTVASVVAVVLGAVVLALVLVLPAARPAGSGLLVRSTGDVLLAGLAVLAWWQLRRASGGGVDAVRVAAPVVCLLAGAAVAPRLLALPLRLADRLARGSRRLVLPLAAFEVARGPRAVAAALLLVLATGVGTFGVAYGATWTRSQGDQADARVGTDLALVAGSPEEGAAAAAAIGGTASPVASRGVVIGQAVGTADTAPWLVAADMTAAGALLRGRPPAGTTWAAVGSRLAPARPVTGLAPAGPVTVSGTSTAATGLQAATRLLVQDRTGLRTPCAPVTLALDGRPHRVTPCTAGRLVGLDLALTSSAGTPPGGATRISVTVTAGAGRSGGTDEWSGAAVGDGSGIGQVTAAAGDGAVRVGALVDLTTVSFVPGRLVATAFARPAAVPVAVSDRLARLGLDVGDEFAGNVGSTVVPMRVAAVVPAVPSRPDRPALLADVDLLSRALIAAGEESPPVDAWWIGDPVHPERAAALGTATLRRDVRERLATGPLQAGLPAALRILVPAAVLLALAGTVLSVAADLETRAVQVARLRGLGLSRRALRGSLVAQHGGLLVLLTAAGVAVGAGAAWLLAPALVRADDGTLPTPAAVVRWPWTAESTLLAVLLLAALTAATLVTALQVRRADATHLRAGT